MSRSYSIAINLLFITAITYLGVTAFYKGLTSRLDYQQLSQKIARSPEPVEPATSKPLSDYTIIEKRNLFKTGEAEKPTVAPPPVQEVAQLKQTDLKLKLWGTVTGSPEQSYAVVEELQKRQQNLYRVGDAIQDATVRQILREEIILTRNGKNEKLSMEKKDGAAGPAGPSSGVPPKNISSAQPAPTPFGSTSNISMKRETIDEAMSDINSLMKQAKIRPHFKNGKPDGLTLSRVRRKSIFTELGLRSGDIITGVNGEDIRSVDDALKFYNNLKSSSNVTLQIKRRGREKNMEYQIE